VALDITVIAALAFIASGLLTGTMRKLAIAYGVVDVPNERSSHTVAVPRGGGLAIVSVFCVAMVVMGLRGVLRSDLLVALAGGVAVAAIGLVDDRRSVNPTIRFLIHLLAALWAVAWLGGLPPLLAGGHPVRLGLLGDLLAVLGIVWTLNLFNFMDGIDGIAASEAVFVAGLGGVLASGGDAGVTVGGLALAACCGGFLIWNWPPAKIFMGDVGSGFLGYTLAVLALAATRSDPAAVWIWLLLGGVFFVDATVTLIRRVLRGDKVYQAHRSHAYQYLSRRWRSHRLVTCSVIALNVLWLLPCAWLARRSPAVTLWIIAAALLPIAALAVLSGAGRSEPNPS
jgi:Fuc2NAc and GlcNAc transferase